MNECLRGWVPVESSRGWGLAVCRPCSWVQDSGGLALSRTSCGFVAGQDKEPLDSGLEEEKLELQEKSCNASGSFILGKGGLRPSKCLELCIATHTWE